MRPKFKVNDKVIVHPENDNDTYDSFRNKTLIITHVATNVNEHRGYDSSMEGMGLYDLKTIDGKEIHCSLYDYELIRY